MNTPKLFMVATIATAFFVQCTAPADEQKQTTETTTPSKPLAKEHKQAPQFTYTLDTAKSFFAANGKTLTEAQENILMAVNRTDKANLKTFKKILVPSDFTGDIENYLPFPVNVPALKDVSKIILFSYPTQTFAAYAYGDLVYTGPTNMGRKKDPTPEGLYYTNWKAEQTTSTFNDEWDLKWNFNIENKEGIGFHQYALPGYPASHSCLRLQEKDAKYLYNWAEQWEIKGTDDILAKGTPVVVFGTYNFDGEKPWLQLVNDPKILNIPVSEIESVTSKYMNDILAQQKKRADYLATKPSK